MRSRHLFAAMAALCVVVALYALVATRLDRTPPTTASTGSPPAAPPTTALPAPSGSAPSGGSTSTATPTEPPVQDVTHLLRPSRRYLGLAAAGAPADMSVVEAFAARTKTRPNMITIYQEFGDPFVASEIRKTYDYGALPILRWEPFDAALADIARGRHDDYVKSYAEAVRGLGLPMAVTFAHEMNGHWYPWGSQQNKGRDFVRAWRRIHRIFEATGASNVIWAWTPNVISGAPGVKLAPWYPGDSYVDWIGVDGYFAVGGPRTYKSLFGPTMKEVQRFSKRPFLIVETGVERGSIRRAALESLLRGVAKDSRMLGVVYFNQRGSRDWLLDDDPSAVAAFASLAKRLDYGFTVR